MARLCVRPGCDRPAEARLSYDPVSCNVWLDPLLDRPGRSQEICALHAGRLTVPRGWILCDQRPQVAASTVEPEHPAGTGVPAGPVEPSRDEPTTLARAIAALPHPVVSSVVPPQPELPWSDAAVGSDDPDGSGDDDDAVEPDGSVEHEDPVADLMRPTSPLLARAFAANGPQQSVLTHGQNPRSDRDPPVRRDRTRRRRPG